MGRILTADLITESTAGESTALRMTSIVLNGPDLIPTFQFNVGRLFMAPLQNSKLLAGVFTNGLLGGQEIVDTN